ncbi:MAG: hypothetical protein IPI92_17195 [Gemmatimonadetes bacterium]|nr:hypothetical protein [Gemmatimonadota bacterium]
MPPRPRYAPHPSLARMQGADADPAAYLREAPVLVDAMYAARPALRPIHDALEELARGLGPDIRLSPGKTIVPVYRTHVIAQIKPATKTRIDFGLALGALKGKGRLLETGGYAKKDRITHRIAVSSLADLDDELRGWLRRAYELNG